MRKLLSIQTLLVILCLSSCSQIPKESVELSATVGRDIAEMHKAYRELVELYYQRLFQDINEIVDEVYTPYQIQKILEEHKDILIGSIEESSLESSSEESKKETLELLGVLVEELRIEIESYRKSKLTPVMMQKEEILRDIDEAYNQIHYANSIITGHLASIMKVHDTQNELLAKTDLNDLRIQVGVKSIELSEKLNIILKKARNGEEQADKLIEEFNTIFK